MKLYFNKPSPYARKVLVTAHEKRLMDRLELVDVDPWKDPPALLADTPVGKVPALVADDGLLMTESTTICEYLDAAGAGASLVGKDRWEVLSRCGLAQGLIDAAFGTVIERRRPSERQWPDWIARQRRAIDRALAVFKTAPGRFDLGDISLACGLAYLDFRLPEIPWRQDHPALAGWLDEAKRRSSMQATVA